MPKTLQEICEFVGGELQGDGNIEIQGVSGIKEALQGEITFVANSKYRSEMSRTRASAIIVSEDMVSADKPTIRVKNPYFAFVRVLEMFSWRKRTQVHYGIHGTAVIGENVSLGERVSIQAHVVIGDNVEIGDDTIVGPLCYIGNDTQVGQGVLIYPNVTIREEISIGDRVIIHSGAVIGSDGFGFAKVSDRHHKIPQIGTVIVEEDVEIGANTTIDRATMTNGATIIKRGTKIDNLVQVAHNVVIGEDCLLAGQVGIAGSVEIADRVTLAGQAGVAGHLKIDANTVVAAKAGVTKDISGNQFVSGFPAVEHTRDLRMMAALSRLPETLSTIQTLQKRIEELEARLGDE